MRSAWKNLADIVLILGGKFSNLAAFFLGGLLIARVAGPAEYGIFAVAMSIVLLGDGFLGAPFDLAVVRFFALHPGEEDRTRRFEAMILQLKAILAIAAIAALLALRSLLGRQWPALAAPTLPLFWCFFALLALLAARSTFACLQNRRRFKIYAAMDLAQGTVRAAGFLILASLQLALAVPYLLIYGLAALAAATTGLLFFQQQHLLGSWPTRPDVARVLRYCGYAAGIVVLGTITGRGDLLLLAMEKGASGSAVYGLASQVAMLMSYVAMYLSVLTQPRLLELHRQGTLRSLFIGNFVAVVCLSLLTLVLWCPVAVTQVLSWAFGQGFVASAPLLRILLVGVFLDWLIVPVLMVFCIQACPGKAFLGEIVITALFLAFATAALLATWPWPLEEMLAWIAVFCRAAKLVLYGGLFLVGTAPRKAPIL